MTKKHDAMLDDVLGDLSDTRPEPPRAPKAESKEGRNPARFLNRSTALADRLSGDAIEKTLLWVDPERCRMWERHNRRYELLNEVRCADLIEGFKAQGQQEFPAIVRSLHDDPNFDYEVICGARRHWTVNWLRENNYRQFRFLIDVREITDEEAFRLSDVENRDREDICDYERAVDYSNALTSYYGGRQKDMAERLEVSEAWLSRYLGLAKLPKIVVDAYSDITEIRERHARDLKPLLNQRISKAAILKEAKTIAEQQSGSVVDGATVFRRLKAVATPRRPTSKPPVSEYKSRDGDLILKAKPKRGRGVVLDIVDIRDTESVLEACRCALQDLQQSS